MRFTCWRGMLAGAIAWAVMAGAASASAGEEVRLEVGGVTLAGSGPNGRDGHVRGFPAYRVIAEHLAGQGVAVLLLDRRGVGGSGGDWRRETIPGRARDAVAAADFLRRRLPGPLSAWWATARAAGWRSRPRPRRARRWTSWC